MLDYGREVCGALDLAAEREWLVTNGLGGYAMGTISGIRTRSYHGLLIAAKAPPGATGLPPAARTLLLAAVEETAAYHGHPYELFTHRYILADNAASPEQDSTLLVEPQGYRYLERFHLEGTTPVWTYALDDALLEKRVWMQPGANTTYVHYCMRRGNSRLSLQMAALVNFRDHHAVISSGKGAGAERRDMAMVPVTRGVRITAKQDPDSPGPNHTLFLFCSRGELLPQHTWREGFYLAMENYRGQADVEAHLQAARLDVHLEPGQCVTLVATSEETAVLCGELAYADRRSYEQALLTLAEDNISPLAKPNPTDGRQHGHRQATVSLGRWLGGRPLVEPAIQHLVLAADQFIVRRALPDGTEGRTVIAGYPWFGDWGRDTMISLSGLTLATGRLQVARQILASFAQYADQGMLPNRFPDAGETPEYNTVDATLWYVEALRAYHAATGDLELLQELYPIMQEIVAWHRAGTRYGIHLDDDGLIYAGEPGVQLTWMDAKVGNWVVTPRMGKPVEINALWYNALRILADVARLLGQTADTADYEALAEQAKAGFERFWNPERGFCYDVLDGPDGNDDSLRPNQLFAVSLHHSPLERWQQRAVVDVCARYLLTSHGLRSLAPDEPGYLGRYGGSRRNRDAAYHQGTVWGWLIGPFVSAYMRVHEEYPGAEVGARSFLRPLLQHLNSHCVGSLSEIFDGDPPHAPRGCIAQAWTVAEVLRVWRETSGKGAQRT